MAVNTDGSMVHIHRHEAAAIVRDGGGDWSDFSYDRVRLNQKGALILRSLSCRVGAPLAIAVLKKESWAEVMLSDIERCPVAPDTIAA